MLTAAPCSLAVFVVTLPVALILTRYAGSYLPLFLLLAVLNMVALARVTLAWYRMTILEGAVYAWTPWGGRARARYLIVLVLLIAVAAALLQTTGDIPYMVYVVLSENSEVLFYCVLFVVLVLVWTPFMYLGSVGLLSLAHMAVTGKLEYASMRPSMRFKRWPLMAALCLLMACAGVTRSMLTDYGKIWSTDNLGYGVLGMLLCIILAGVVTVMSAVAYRESRRVAALESV
ncbi:hypothetical protein [Achromobacter pestifer]|uniref:Uncharacterized protein n=1 Tax=Achromobacter pestifer TaxID=1353889 RepID=A0A6S6ZLI6_9BURK|nr:hypothetical protein [Achromobacter pestifer]CAB3685081.1 hypothetical protein LMG3431_04572 [Achromobacter pestifer]